MRLLVGKLGALSDQDRADVAATFQATVANHLAERTARGMDVFAEGHPEARILVIAGGVAANTALRAALTTMATKKGFTLVVPPVRLCTDNGAMIAWAGVERFRLGLTDGLGFRTPAALAPRSRGHTFDRRRRESLTLPIPGNAA